MATAFLELWRRRDTVRVIEGAVLPWLLVTTTNAARNSNRASLRRRKLLSSLQRTNGSRKGTGHRDRNRVSRRSPEAQIALNAEDLSDRPGFDEQFLGARVGMPPLLGVESVLFPYTHFSILMRLHKRLAAVTALGIDGTKLIALDRSGIQWKLDPRLRADEQAGETVYARNDVDRGHLVRRASAVWGDTPAEAARANADTFRYTNAAPQAAKFNQGMDLWLGLESYLQENAADNSRRLVVFTGPIFGDTDPV